MRRLVGALLAALLPLPLVVIAGSPAVADGEVPGASIVVTATMFDARAINDLGQVLGFGPGGYFVWDEFGTEPLAAPPGNPAPQKLQDSGALVGVAFGGGGLVPWLWIEGEPFQLALPDDADSVASLDVNTHHIVVGTAFDVDQEDPLQIQSPVLWQGASAPTIVPGVASVHAVNDEGQLLVADRLVDPGPGGQRGVYADRVVSIGGAPGFSISHLSRPGFRASPRFVEFHESGDIIGTTVFDSETEPPVSDSVATLWRQGVPVELPGSREGIDVNGTGHVVGLDASGVPTLWLPDLRSFPIVDMIPAGSEVVSVESVGGINDRCEIAGRGRNAANQPRVFKLRLHDCGPPPLEVTIDAPVSVAVDEEFELTVDLRNRSEDVAITDLTVLDDVGISLSPNLELLEGPDPEPPTTLDPDTTVTLRYTLVSHALETHTVRASAEGVAGGVPVFDEDEQRIGGGSPLAVTIAQSPEEIELTIPDDQADDPDATPEPVEFTALVTVTNTLEVAVDDVTLPPVDELELLADDGYTGGRTRIERVAGPCTELPCLPPGEGEEPDPDGGDLGTLAPAGEDGDSKIGFYTLRFLDDARYEARLTVESADPFVDGAIARSRGSGILEAGEPERVRVTVEVESAYDPETCAELNRPAIECVPIEGTTLTVYGTVENLSTTEPIQFESLAFDVHDLGIGLPPVPFDPLEAPDAHDELAVCRMPEAPEEIPPEGEWQFMQEIPIRSLDVPSGPRVTARYEVTATYEDEEGATLETSDETGELVVPVRQEPLPPWDPHAFAYRYSDVALESIVNFWLTPVRAGEAVAGYFDDPNAPPLTELLSTSARNSWDFVQEWWSRKTPAEKALFAITLGVGGLADQVVQDWDQKITAFTEAWYAGDYETAADGLGQILAGALGELSAELALAPLWPVACGAIVSALARRLPVERVGLVVPGTLAEFAQTIGKTSDTVTLADLALRPSGIDLPVTDAARLWGITEDQLQRLIQYADEQGIRIYPRDRTLRAAQEIEAGRWVGKPQGIKVKTVNDIDVEYLGYPGGDDGVNQVFFREPQPDWVAINALPAPDRAMVLKRLKDRLKEWNDPLLRWLYRGEQVLNDAGDWVHFDTVTGTWRTIDPNTVRPFSETGVEVRIDGQFRVVDYELGPDGKVLLDGRPVGGDADILAITRADGSLFTADDLDEVLQHLHFLDDVLGLQHGVTALWWVSNAEQAFIRDVVTFAGHAIGGKPVLEIAGTGLRPVWWDQAMSYFPDPSRGEFGLPRALRFVGDVRDTAVPTLPASVVDGLVGPVGRHILDHVLLDPVWEYLPGFECDGTTRDRSADAGVYRAADGGEGPFEAWTPEDGWFPVELASRCASPLHVLPWAPLLEPASAGDTVLEVAHDEVLFAGEDDWFRPGDRVVIDPGGANEEYGTVAALGSIVLDAPLQSDHAHGEMVSVVTCDGIDGATDPACGGGGAGGGGGDGGGGPSEQPPAPPTEGGAPCPPGHPVPVTFPDVDPASVHRPAIECLTFLGVVTGLADGRFGPADGATRGQVASLLVRLLGLTASGGTNPFADDDGSVHEAAVGILAELGVLTGFPDGTIRVDEVLSRGQAVSLLVRALEEVLGHPLAPGAVDAFADDDGSVHEDAVDVAHAAGLFEGRADGTSGVTDPVRRDQLATLLVRALAIVRPRSEP